MVTLANVGPATAAFYRCALALPGLFLLTFLEQRRLGPRPVRVRLSVLGAGLILAADLVLWNHSILDVGAGVATVLGNLQVLVVGGLAWLLFRERPGRRYLIMLPVVLLGVVLVSGLVGHTAAGLHPLAGVVYGLATSAAYACVLLILKHAAGSGRHVAGQLADLTAGGAVGALVIGLASGGFNVHVPWPSLGWLLVLALLSQTVGWLLITSSLPRLPATVAPLLPLLQPAAALVLADVVLGEQPSLIQVLGALLVCAGVLVVTWTRAPQRGRAPARPRVSDDAAADRPAGVCATAES
jgi:drug/metabolite transporter (DMT)-like permease